MKIDSANISMFSSHNLRERHLKKKALKMWIGNERPDFEGTKREAGEIPAAKIDISLISPDTATDKTVERSDSDTIALSPEDKVKVLLVEAMLEALTGRKIRIAIPKIPDPKAANMELPVQQQDSNVPAQEKQGWGIEYDSQESH